MVDESSEMNRREEVLESMRQLCAENYRHAMRMSEHLRSANIMDDIRPFAEQRRYSELAFAQLVAYLRAQGWHGAIPDEDDQGAVDLMHEKIFNGEPLEP